ncbi:hypothetical protein EJC51_46215 [Streptomyces aquilus]|uniref:Uncharacterized protein n=1 Tax=Streptomyces aquilus TaxID=2548456 RepID=A0A3Q9C2M0_9ACTN|nr:hypothetical protein [Streptomyces aquilus]AZP22796.1 hypothetical protein EJC51_46215 [Streptomyces aquilus]
MDVDQIVAELYGLPPKEFVAARDVRVAEARQAKDPAAARTLAALRRPTTAAWASNLFVRQRPKEVDRLLALGQTLREAHRMLDAGQFREASRQQHQMIAALARETAGLAKAAGLALTEPVRHEVEQILHSVLADPAIADEWAAGRLTKAPEATVGFTAVAPDTVPAHPATASSAEKRPARQDTARQAQLDAARTASQDAVSEAGRREEALAEAQQAQQAADARLEQVQARVAELEEQLQKARKDQREASAAAGLARDAVGEARRAATNARRTAARASAKLAKLGQTADAKQRPEPS